MTREPSDIAVALVDLVDVLLPGDDLFPKASTIGLQALVAERILAQRGESGLDQLLDTIDACGGPLAELDQDRRADVIDRFEQGHEDLFTLLRNAAFLGYYQHPAVHAAIRAIGHPYHAVLLPTGYAVKPFDPGHRYAPPPPWLVQENRRGRPGRSVRPRVSRAGDARCLSPATSW